MINFTTIKPKKKKKKEKPEHGPSAPNVLGNSRVELHFQLMRFMSSAAARPKVLRFGTRLFPLFNWE